MSISLFSFALFFVQFVSATPTSEVADFASGVTAYQENDFAKAQGVFQQLLSDQPENPVLLYNLGLAEYQLEHWGLALGLWRKAYDLDPSYSPPKVALNFAEDKLFPQQQTQSIFETIYQSLATLPLTFWILLSFAATFALLWFSIDYGAKRQAPFLQWPAWLLSMIPIASFICLVTLILFLDQAQMKATVVQKNLKTHAAPSETSPTLTELSEGQVVEIEKVAGQWAQVRPNGGTPGWVPQSSLIAFGGI